MSNYSGVSLNEKIVSVAATCLLHLVEAVDNSVATAWQNLYTDAAKQMLETQGKLLNNKYQHYNQAH